MAVREHHEEGEDMKRKDIRNICLSLLAGAAVLTTGVNSALAYFTTYTTAEGGLPEITETFDSKTKHLVITSDADSEPVYIRARAFCARYEVAYQSSPEGIWTQESGVWNKVVPGGEADGDWYYYKEIVPGGGSAATLDVVIDIPPVPEGNEPGQTKPEDGESFNVIVIYESTPVRYDENGEPYADWSETLDVVTATGKPDADGSTSEREIEEQTGTGGNSENGAGGDGNVGE